MKKIHKTLIIVTALIWFINGFVYKLLNLSPRHQGIVGAILGDGYAFILTKIIGTLEVLLAFWIITNYKSKTATIVQVILVITMNIIEYIKVPNLLLFGKMNLVFSLMFVSVLLVNEYYFKKKATLAT